MNPNNEKAAPEVAATGNGSECLLKGKQLQYKGSEPPPPKKIEVCLGYFIERGLKGMNTLEAKKLYGDTCTHTTVSTLHNEHNIYISRKPERILNRAGTLSRFMRYWIDKDALDSAKRLHAHLRSQRGLLPLYEICKEAE